jgi:DNA-binding MarR family transcriptional regulator
MASAPSPPFASTCTCFRLRKFSRLLSQRYDAALAPAGLNVNQLSILRRADHAPHTVGSLARELGMERSTLSRDLKHVAGNGWVRMATGEDARQKRIVVTAAGRRVIARALPLWRQVQEATRSRVGEDALERLHADLDAALARLGDPS